MKARLQVCGKELVSVRVKSEVDRTNFVGAKKEVAMLLHGVLPLFFDR